MWPLRRRHTLQSYSRRAESFPGEDTLKSPPRQNGPSQPGRKAEKSDNPNLEGLASVSGFPRITSGGTPTTAVHLPKWEVPKKQANFDFALFWEIFERATE